MHSFDRTVAPERSAEHNGLRAWPPPSDVTPIEEELLYLTCVRPSEAVRSQVLMDPLSHLASFGQDATLKSTILEAWGADLDAWMVPSSYRLADPTELFSLTFTLLDSDTGEYPVRLFAQSLTQDHAALLYHQPSVQLTPMVAGILSQDEVTRSAALRLSQMTTPLVPMNVLEESQSTLAVEEIARLAFASSRLHLPQVLDATAAGMLLLLRGRIPE